MSRCFGGLAVGLLLVACGGDPGPTLFENPRLARVERGELSKLLRDLGAASRAEISILLGAPRCDPQGCVWSRQVRHFSGALPAAPGEPAIRVARGDTFLVACRATCDIDVIPGRAWPSRAWPR